MASNKNFKLAFEIGGKVAALSPKSFTTANQAVAKLNAELAGLTKEHGEIQKLQSVKVKVGQTALEYHKAAARVEELQKQIKTRPIQPERCFVTLRRQKHIHRIYEHHYVLSVKNWPL
ncbi:hypothetical protein LB437_25710 [Escherichia coli]|uniref:hypothetical protein n=1 Tax=Escherichia coli TaxID=562 RepID=UPI004062918A